MPRSSKKGPYVCYKLLKKVRSAKENVIKTWSRASMIIPDFIGKNFAVHNGKKFIPIHVVADMVGHKLGEFAPTRVFRGRS